ncbi:metal-dependent hydrolase family protein [Pleomorphomonas koreensis]|uniref:metal-dependent hydrolase family protein n=1 Tax=Pleomorphomonas koreensis TaxID=257440 RepID=UPI000411FCBE|nr:amidohydrolase family protein [Pleomorphomonas koreensis]
MLFINGAIFDGEALLPAGHALLVEGGRIARIAPGAAFAGYAGPTIDAAGMTILPGLIDCHAHLVLGGELNPAAAVTGISHVELTLRCLENALASLAGGVTSLRDLGGIDHVELRVRDAFNSGRVFGPTVRAAGKFICMTGGTNYFIARQADGPDEVVKAVREQIHAGCDCVKLMATGGVLTPGVRLEHAQFTCEEMTAGVNEARRFGRPVASHAMTPAGVLNAVRAGVGSIEHGVLLDEECIDEMLARDVVLVPTLMPFQRLLASNAGGVPEWAMEKARWASERHRKSFKAYYDAGGRIAMGADTGTPFNPHGNAAWELFHMVSAGMKPADALKAGTATAADLLRLDDRGRLREGFAADIVVVAGDPLADIAAVADRAGHRLILKDGRTVLDGRASPAGHAGMHLRFGAVGV